MTIKERILGDGWSSQFSKVSMKLDIFKITVSL